MFVSTYGKGLQGLQFIRGAALDMDGEGLGHLLPAVAYTDGCRLCSQRLPGGLVLLAGGCHNQDKDDEIEGVHNRTVGTDRAPAVHGLDEAVLHTGTGSVGYLLCFLIMSMRCPVPG